MGGHVVCMRKIRNSFKISVRKPEGEAHIENLDGDGMIILNWILRL
jgi:hypothetical protein